MLTRSVRTRGTTEGGLPDLHHNNIFKLQSIWLLMKTLAEIDLEEQGYRNLGVMEVADRRLERHEDYQTFYGNIPTSAQLTEQIRKNNGLSHIKLFPFDLKFPLELAIVYAK